jgi:hypothetical protein
MSGVGVQVDFLLHELLDVLKVACHSFLEVLLSVSDIVRHLTSDLVDDDWNSTNAVLTFACASGVSAVAVSGFEVHRFHSVG